LTRTSKPPALAPNSLHLPSVVLALGVLAIFIPTMYSVATSEWTSEQGGHGPIVVATGGWLLWRELGRSRPKMCPGRLSLGLMVLVPMLAVFVLARITGILEVEAFAMYFVLLAAAYLLFGGALLRAIWFPLVYLALALPPPDSVVAAVTQPIKIAISQWAVALLHWIGYPIAGSGVTIEIAQYQLLVAAACAGLNSIISLSAICIFYSYLRHRSDPMSFVVIAIAVIPIATFSNFVRVLVLILITYYFGEAAAQGFLHDFAGLTMFAVALVTVFGIDSLFTRLRELRRSKEAS
jgi:exosortase